MGGSIFFLIFHLLLYIVEEKVPKPIEWLTTHKDALLALGAFLAPLTSIIAAAVSYRAVVTGPRIQLQIAKQQNDLANRQHELNERQFELSFRQARSPIVSAMEERWITEFQITLSDLFSGAAKLQNIRQLWETHPDIRMDEAVQLQEQLSALIAKLRISMDSESSHATAFMLFLRRWSFAQDKLDVNGWVSQEWEVYDLTQTIIGERRARITAELPSPRGDDQMP